jgi:hypothetical protein
MTIIDHVKAALVTAQAHEQATADLRVAAFQNYQAAGRSNDNGDYSIYEAARSSHIAACDAVRKLENLANLEAEEADLQRLINSLNS